MVNEDAIFAGAGGLSASIVDMARLGAMENQPGGAESQGPKRTSIWQSIHPRLLEIIRGRTSTLIFVNARRVAERLAVYRDAGVGTLAITPVALTHEERLEQIRLIAELAA